MYKAEGRRRPHDAGLTLRETGVGGFTSNDLKNEALAEVYVMEARL